MTEKGTYINLFRKFTQWEWYTDIPTKTLFLHLLLIVNHKPNKWRGMEVDQGQKITSISTLAKETGLSHKQVRSSLEKLKRTGEVGTLTTNKYTLLTVVNYDIYQNIEGTQRANKGHTEGKQRATNNKDNKENKENKEIKKLYGEFDNVSLSDDEHEKIKEGNMEYLVEELSSYIESTGKRYKSHYATILNWSRKRKPEVKEIVPDFMQENKGGKRKYEKVD